MNASRKVLLSVLALLVAFGAGAFLGYRFFLRPQLWLASVGESFIAGQYAYTQYREASYPEAQHALEAYLAYLDSQQPSETDSSAPGQNPWLGARGVRFDKTLTWARLAVLHENNGQSAASDQAWKHAEALAAQGTWKDARREHLREVVGRLDKSISFPQSPKPGGT
jgi:hypothetical protein